MTERKAVFFGAGVALLASYFAAANMPSQDPEPARERPAVARAWVELMRRLGYDNVRIVHGDGSKGSPEEAPFEAILAAASGSHVPDILKRQLSIGGTLVMPVGEPDTVQKLVKVTRRGDRDFEQEDLGPVRFVPLIGAHGWTERGERAS